MPERQEVLAEREDEEGERQQKSTKRSLLCSNSAGTTTSTPPVLQGHVPPELLPPGKYPLSLHLYLLFNPILESNHLHLPPPLEPPSREDSTQTAQPGQRQAQEEPSVPSQQSLPSTHKCPDLGPAAPMTHEYVPSRGVNPAPATPTACLQGNMALGIVAPSSPPM